MSNIIVDNMSKLRKQFEDIEKQLSSQEVASNPTLLMKLSKERSDLEPKITAFDEYMKLSEELIEAKAMLDEESDEEMLELAKLEEHELAGRCETLEEDLKIMLLPKDPLDGKDIIMEIRAGTGGDEAALFAGDLYKMYSHYAEKSGWKTESLALTPSDMGGFKEVIFSISGSDVYSLLKYESGVHRVQRVPATESQGRIHTSAASVVVLPEAKDVNIEVSQNDLKIDVYRSSGPGGQSVNTTDSAVRITHIPTGMVVTCQDEKSQHKNKAKALKVLKARLLDNEMKKAQSERSAARKDMVSSGDRSAKIRTFNYPQGRVTDHRINLTLYRLEEILQGNLEELVETIRLEDRKKALEAQAKELEGKVI